MRLFEFLPLAGLLALAPACSVHSSGHYGWTVQGDGVVTTTSADGQNTVTARWTDADIETLVKTEGEIHLLPDDSDVAAIDGDGELIVKEKSWSGTRELAITKIDGNRLRYVYLEDNQPSDYGPSERDWFASVLQEAVQRTPIGARSRARNLMASGGSQALLAQVSELSSSSARDIYFEELMNAEGTGPDDLVRAVEVAGQSYTSSSSLGEFLESVSQRHTSNLPLTLEILSVSESISSSSTREEVLETLVTHRPLDAVSSVEALRSTASISSTSSRSEAAQSILENAPPNAELHVAFLEIVSNLSSSSSQEESLESMLELEGLPSATLVAIVHTSGSISSTSSRTSILNDVLRREPLEEAVVHEILEQVATLSSSSSQREVLESVLSRPYLSKDSLRKANQIVEHVSSSSTRADLQERIIERLLAEG